MQLAFSMTLKHLKSIVLGLKRTTETTTLWILLRCCPLWLYPSGPQQAIGNCRQDIGRQFLPFVEPISSFTASIGR